MEAAAPELQGEAEAEAEAGAAAFLAWEELTALLPNSGEGPTRRLINGLSGYALPGRIMAVMGPSGSGKSTFLDSLAGYTHFSKSSFISSLHLHIYFNCFMESSLH